VPAAAAPAADAATAATSAATQALDSAPRGPQGALFANPNRPAAYGAGGEEQLLNAGSVIRATPPFKSYFTGSTA